MTLINKCIKHHDGHRVVHPRETIEKITSQMSNLGLRIKFSKPRISVGGIAAVQCHVTDCDDENTILLTSGKGENIHLAEASGAGEAVERLSAGYDGTIKPKKHEQMVFRRTRFEDRISAGTYQYLFRSELEKFNELCSKYNKPGIRGCWRKCTSLNDETIEYVFPEDLITCGFGTNGLAAGNTLEEAISHGINEVVERYAFRRFIAKLESQHLHLIEKESLKSREPLFKRILDELENRLIDVSIYYYSFLGMPIIIAHFIRQSHSFGLTHPLSYRSSTQTVSVGVETDPVQALLRCFWEFIQIEGFYAGYFRQIYDDMFEKLGIKTRLPEPTPSYAQWLRKLMLPIDSKVNVGDVLEKLKTRIEKMQIEDIPSIYDRDIKVEISRMSSSLLERNIRIFFQDLTLKSLDFPAVRVFLLSSNLQESVHTSPLSFVSNPWTSNENGFWHPLFGKYSVTLRANQFIKDPIWCDLTQISQLNKLNISEVKKIRAKIEGVLYYLYYLAIPRGTLFNNWVDLYELLIRLNLHLQDHRRIDAIADALLNSDPIDGLGLLAKLIACKELDAERAVEIEDTIQMVYPDIEIEEEIASLRENLSLDILECDGKSCGTPNTKPICKTCVFNYIPTPEYE